MSVLMFADTLRSPDLRHVVSIPIADPFVYAEHGDRRVVVVNAVEAPRLRELGGLEVVPFEELGVDQLLADGLTLHEARFELAHRACTSLGIEEASIPGDFPVLVADLLRERGIRLDPDPALFAERRRVKTPGELEGIRRAWDATRVALETIRDAVRRGGELSSESLREAARRETSSADVFFEHMMVSHGAQSASGHEFGWGRIEEGEPIIVDLCVRDGASGAWSDVTRTFCVGTPPAELVAYQQTCLAALEHVTPMVRTGANGAELHRQADAVVAAAGYPTKLTKEPGTVLESGFYHSLGHGVGLELHEAPSLAPNGGDLVAGDVVTIEPGLYRPGFGGCRLEDLVLVTDDGPELLTHFPYELV